MQSINYRAVLAGIVALWSLQSLAQVHGEAGTYPASLDHRPEGWGIVSAEPWSAHADRPRPAADHLPEPSELDPAPAVNRATFTVGSDASCDFPSVSAALSSSSVGDGDVLNLRSDLNQSGTVLIVDRPGSLTLRGGFANCSEPVPTGTTNFTGTSGARVVELRTAASFAGPRMVINLERINVSGGTATGGFGGGGLLVNGRPGAIEVNLRRVTVSNNSSSFNGGGISVRVIGDRLGTAVPPPMLTMDNQSVIVQNTASLNGGGLSCTSAGFVTGTTVVRLGTVFVAANQAQNGGGISVDGCANVLIYPGISIRGINSNTASGFGGGVYVRRDESRVRILGNAFDEWGDANNGGYLGGNTAQRGGGIYARDDSYIDTRDIHFINNTATVEGGAVAVDEGPALALIERHLPTSPCISGSGALRLERCSVVRGNSGGNAGGAFSARNGGEIEVVRTRVHDNSSDVAAIAATSGASPGNIRLESVVAWGNQSTWGVASANGLIELRWSTFADNNISDEFIRVNGAAPGQARVNVLGSILREAGTTAAIAGLSGMNDLVFDCVIGWQEAGSVPGAKAFYRVLDPQFVNPDERDYRQGPTSPAIDFCDAVPQPPPRDFNGLSRGLVHLGEPITPGGPGIGPYDLGAFEPRWRPDLLFGDRFE